MSKSNLKVNETESKTLSEKDTEIMRVRNIIAGMTLEDYLLSFIIAAASVSGHQAKG